MSRQARRTAGAGPANGVCSEIPATSFSLDITARKRQFNGLPCGADPARAPRQDLQYRRRLGHLSFLSDFGCGTALSQILQWDSATQECPRRSRTTVPSLAAAN